MQRRSKHDVYHGKCGSKSDCRKDTFQLQTGCSRSKYSFTNKLETNVNKMAVLPAMWNEDTLTGGRITIPPRRLFPWEEPDSALPSPIDHYERWPKISRPPPLATSPPPRLNTKWLPQVLSLPWPSKCPMVWWTWLNTIIKLWALCGPQ